MTEDKLSAYQTLYKCLETVALLIAPFSPFYADKLYRDLTLATTGEEKSVHLAFFPKADDVIDKHLEEEMKFAQDITSMVLALRRKANLKVRQPLMAIMIPVIDNEQKETIDAMSQLIMGEVNVKEIRYVRSEDGILVKKVKPDFKKLGPKCGKAMKQVAATISALSQAEILEFEKNGSYTVNVDGNDIAIDATDVEIFSQDIPGWLVANEGSLTVALDITLTEELKAEGIAREIVNRIQNIRKDLNFDITDRIDVIISHNENTDKAIEQYQDYIAKQVLANSVTIGDIKEEDQIKLTKMEEYGDISVSIKISK